MPRYLVLTGLLAAFLLVPRSAAGAVAAAITILEGEALIYRSAGRLRALEGVRLLPGDIVETVGSGFAQIELHDRSAVQLGPDTRVMLNAGWLYVLEGWVKLSGAPDESRKGPGFEVRAPLIEMPRPAAVVVFNTSAAEVTMYVERGETQIVERRASGPEPTVTLKAGDYYRRKSGAAGNVLAGAARQAAMQSLLDQMPRVFRDSLPARIDQLRERNVKAPPAPPFTYADVEPWLKAEPSVRRQFVQRWRARIADRAFRAALVANLSAHPEWDPMLFPEKYLPKDPMLK